MQISQKNYIKWSVKRQSWSANCKWWTANWNPGYYTYTLYIVYYYYIIYYIIYIFLWSSTNFDKLQCYFFFASENIENFSIYVHCIFLLYSLTTFFFVNISFDCNFDFLTPPIHFTRKRWSPSYISYFLYEVPLALIKFWNC